MKLLLHLEKSLLLAGLLLVQGCAMQWGADIQWDSRDQILMSEKSQVEPDGLGSFEPRLEGIAEGHEFVGLDDVRCCSEQGDWVLQQGNVHLSTKRFLSSQRWFFKYSLIRHYSAAFALKYFQQDQQYSL